MTLMKLNEKLLPAPEDTASLVARAVRRVAERAFVPYMAERATEDRMRSANVEVATALDYVIDACNSLLLWTDPKLEVLIDLFESMPSDVREDGEPLPREEAERRRRSYLTFVRQYARQYVRQSDLVVESDATSTVEYWRQRALEAEKTLGEVRAVIAEIAKGGE